MATVSGSVGLAGANRRDDVSTVQRLLNAHIAPGGNSLRVDGIAGPQTIAAIRSFQQRIVQLRVPDGRVDPGGPTLRALQRSPSSMAGAQPSTARTSQLSGAVWWRANQAKYPNSQRLEDLEGSFRERCELFIGVMRRGGAAVSISSTRRSPLRAHLMHYSWRVARRELLASEVPAIAGVDITWDHGDERASVRGAQEMVDLFGLAHSASLTSNHIRGSAIDMTIAWNGGLRIDSASGVPTEIAMGPRNGDNPLLQRVGDSYGVKKLRTDPPHWSIDGR